MGDQDIKISLNKILKLAEDIWKYRKIEKHIKEKPHISSKLHRIIENFFIDLEIEIIDLTGKEYDPGMAVKVIHFNKNSDDKVKKIDKMISPIILYQGRVVKMGEVILSN